MIDISGINKSRRRKRSLYQTITFKILQLAIKSRPAMQFPDIQQISVNSSTTNKSDISKHISSIIFSSLLIYFFLFILIVSIEQLIDIIVQE